MTCMPSKLNVYVIRFYYVRTGGQILTVLYSRSTVRTIISNNDRQYCRLLKLNNKAVKAFMFFYHAFNPLNKFTNIFKLISAFLLSIVGYFIGKSKTAR